MFCAEDVARGGVVEVADVVVVGFGLAGAAAALAAAGAGARVQVVAGRRARARRENSARLALRAAAFEAGIAVRAPATAHELLVEGGRVVGVGYAALEAGSAAELAHRFLRRAVGPARPRPRSIGTALLGVADALWERASAVGTIACSSVVLALDPSGWEFVGPAVWAACHESPGRGRLGLAGDASALPVPVGAELAVREWSATRAGEPGLGTAQPELRVDRVTGGVLTGDGHRVPGLYCAFPDPGDLPTADVHGVERRIAAGRRAGAAAAAGSARPRLRSVG